MHNYFPTPAVRRLGAASKLIFILSLVFLDLFIGAFSRRANAAGFEILEQSAQGLGSAFAGSTAGFGDGSEVYLNPAAMAALQGSSYQGATRSAFINLISARTKFSQADKNPGTNDTVIGADDSSKESILIPAAYFVNPVTEDLTLGIGVNSPFGLRTSYSADWVGRYQATQSEITTINISPAVSYKAWKCECGGYYLSLGAAANVYYLDAKLENAIDFGQLGANTLGEGAALGQGLAPQQNDGYSKITGDDWAVGFTLGSQFAYDDNRSTIGLVWHSAVFSTLSGRANFTVPDAASVLNSAGLFSDTSVSAGLTLPESIGIGGQHWISEDTALLYDAHWTRWSRFNELRVDFESGQQDFVSDEGWDNVWRFSAGAKHELTDSWTVRGGVTYDASPVSDAEHRTPRIPDADRYWLATGLSYNVNAYTKIDLSYAHLFVADESSNLSSSAGGELNGDWSSAVDIVALGISTAW